MKQKDVKIYNDPIDFENLDYIQYPCTTQYMRYNALLMQYQLTNEGLEKYGLDAQNKLIGLTVEQFIENVSKKIYDFINYRVGLENFIVMQYRIATAPTKLYFDQYSFRKGFEKILIEQARYTLENGDSAKVSRFSLDIGDNPAPRPDEATRDTSDLAPESLRALEGYGLLRWHNITNARALDRSKF